MGDVAGIGPEIIASAWPSLIALGQPILVGDATWLQKGLQLVGSNARIQVIRDFDEALPKIDIIPCLLASTANLSSVVPGQVSAAAGQAAYDYLCTAIDLALAGTVDAIVTCPLHKEGLRAAGLPFPGHTEILADHTNAPRHAMLLYADGLSVLHVTLHIALRDALPNITTAGIRDAIELLHTLLPRLIDRVPRIAVCALNPHASDGGLFGDEESRILEPAVRECRENKINVTGPLPADALWAQAATGAYDGVVAMYHDQGHIPMKMRFGRKLVNITAGLPIIRTSVAHGTAYDIAGQAKADPSSLIVAAEIAARLARKRK